MRAGSFAKPAVRHRRFVPWLTPAASRRGGHYFRSGDASLDQEQAGGRYAAGLVLQLPARGSGSVALRSVDLIGSTEYLVDAIAHGYEVAILT
jgi:hypothetical protein